MGSTSPRCLVVVPGQPWVILLGHGTLQVAGGLGPWPNVWLLTPPRPTLHKVRFPEPAVSGRRAAGSGQRACRWAATRRHAGGAERLEAQALRTCVHIGGSLRSAFGQPSVSLRSALHQAHELLRSAPTLSCPTGPAGRLEVAPQGGKHVPTYSATLKAALYAPFEGRKSDAENGFEN